MKLFYSKYWQNPPITAAIHYFQKQPLEVFSKQGILKKSQNSQESTYAGVLFDKVAFPEACFPVNFAKLLRKHFLQNSSGGSY